jgi:hypothetical protein
MLPSDVPRGRRIDILSRMLRQPWRFLLKGKGTTRFVLMLSVSGMLITGLPQPLGWATGLFFLAWAGYDWKNGYFRTRR